MVEIKEERRMWSDQGGTHRPTDMGRLCCGVSQSLSHADSWADSARGWAVRRVRQFPSGPDAALSG